MAGAEAAGTPAILQISENCVRYHGGLAGIGAAAVAVAAGARVPIAVHLDHATSLTLVEQAVALGFGSVMFDASAEENAVNVRTTAEVVAVCHAAGVWVEGELGEVGGKDGDHAAEGRTDPGQAVEYVAATGIDALAVAVGTSHQMVTRDAALDFALIAELEAAVPVPLVLHGSSGVADEDLTRAVERGMRKVNIATYLNKVLTDTVRAQLAADPAVVDPRVYLGAGRSAVAREVTRLLGVLMAAPWV